MRNRYEEFPSFKHLEAKKKRIEALSPKEKDFFKECIKKFHKELLPHFGSGSNVELEVIIDGLLANPDFICIIELGKGMIIGHVAPYLFNPNKRVASEIGWYVLPEHRNGSVGIRLVRDFEQVAKIMGAEILLMATLAGNDISSYYEKKGYNAQEKFYYKEI